MYGNCRLLRHQRGQKRLQGRPVGTQALPAAIQNAPELAKCLIKGVVDDRVLEFTAVRHIGGGIRESALNYRLAVGTPAAQALLERLARWGQDKDADASR